VPEETAQSIEIFRVIPVEETLIESIRQQGNNEGYDSIRYDSIRYDSISLIRCPQFLHSLKDIDSRLEENPAAWSDGLIVTIVVMFLVHHEGPAEANGTGLVSLEADRS
jgi:hypothetical protein